MLTIFYILFETLWTVPYLILVMLVIVWRTFNLYYNMEPAASQGWRLLRCIREPIAMHSKISLNGMFLIRAFGKEE